MDTESIFQTIQAISLTVAALIAIYSINAWRNEFVGKRRIDLAEEVLVRFYEARDAVRAIRNPFAFAGEGSSRQAGEREAPDEKQILDQAFVAFERYEKHSDLFNQLQSLRYRFMAQFGVDAVQPFDDLSRALNEIFISARMLGRYYWRERNRPNRRTEEEAQQRVAETERHEAVFWQTAEDDDIATRVDRAVARIEEISNDVIRREPKRGFPWLFPWRLPIRIARKAKDAMSSEKVNSL